MTSGRMHADEVETDATLVRRLLLAQFPRWADLSIEAVPSAGTDNAIYRLGDDLAVRRPRIHRAIGQVEKEHRWLARLAPHLPLSIDAATAAWEAALYAPAWQRPLVWIHGDLKPGNLLAGREVGAGHCPSR